MPRPTPYEVAAHFRIPPAVVSAFAAWRGRDRGNDEVRSVLVIRLDEIGDLVLTLPLLLGVRDTWPAARVTAVVRSASAGLLRGSDIVDEVVTFEPLAGLGPTVFGQLRALRFGARQRRGGPVDLVLLPRWDVDGTQSRYVAVGSGGARILGHDPRRRSGPWFERAERALLTETVGGSLHGALDPPAVHELVRIEALSRSAGITVAKRERPGRRLLDARVRSVAGRIVAPLARPGHAPRLLVVAPGAGAAKRRWPARRYAAVATRLADTAPWGVVVVGGERERELAEEFRAGLGERVPVVDAVGRMNLRETLAVLERADLFLGGDSGPAHLAFSVGTAAVVVSCHPRGGEPWSVNAPERFGPWGAAPAECVRPGAIAPCTAECVASQAHCVLGVRVDDVHRAARRLLDSLLTPERT